MKVIIKDLRHGLMKVRVEDNEDLWALSQIIKPGDLLSGDTNRLIKKEDREGKRKKVWLKINVEKMDFRQATFVLKVLGKIIEGPGDVPLGDYHSFNLEEGSIITIEKEEWTSYEKTKVKKSQHKPIKLLITIVDSQAATHFLMESDVKKLYSHESSLPRKDMSDYDARLNQYYQEVLDQIIKEVKDYEPARVIIGGPGFSAEEIIKRAKKPLSEKLLKAHTNQVGRHGVKELINSGFIDQIAKDNEISEETRLINEFMKRLAKNKLVKYGLEEVKKAVELGAVETLLVSEGLVIDYHRGKRYKELEMIINKAETTNTRIEFIGTRHESGKKFYKFNGIGALLRYKI